MSPALRIALLGAGKMAIQHGAAIRHCAGAELVAVVDPGVPSDEIRARFGQEGRPDDPRIAAGAHCTGRNEVRHG